MIGVQLSGLSPPFFDLAQGRLMTLAPKSEEHKIQMIYNVHNNFPNAVTSCEMSTISFLFHFHINIIN